MNYPAIDRRAHPPGASLSNWSGAGGWALRRMDWPQPDGAGARGSLIFANGRGDFVEKYLEALGHWHGRGWNITSFDWRGQGGSQGYIRGGHLDSFDPLLDDLQSLVRDWLEKTPAPHAIAGHSMGGHLLLRLLAERSPPIQAAVLVAPMIAINAAPVPAWIGRRVARTLAAMGWSERRAWKHNERPAPPGSTRQGFLTSCPERYADELWWRERQPGFNLGPPSWGWLDAAYRSMESVTPARMRAIRTPILLLGAARDRLVSPTAIRLAAKLLPDVELVMFQEAAHELLRESDPVRLEALARIDAFLDARAPA
ncbi:MAG TPA: alpha/beta hydrolase [Allosphingosinicella sp.]|nr:alpha/beta hydrolase [Allosphingosinicella sp.]